MNKKLFLSALPVCLLVFGLVFASCDNGGTKPSYEGTWAKDTDLLVINGTNYTFSQEVSGTLTVVSKGTVAADLSAISGVFTINQTHLINVTTSQLEPNPQEGTGTFSVTGNTMVFSGFGGIFSVVNGTWTK